MVHKTKITSVILACFRLMPTRMRIVLFTFFFRLFYYVSVKQRLIAIQNLTLAFPDMSMPEILRIVMGVYRNMGIVAAEFVDIPSLKKEHLGDLVEVEGLENCVNALKKNKGLLMFGAHLGNWEMEAAVVALLLKPLMVIYRPLDSAVLDNLVTWVRSATGNIPLAKDFAMRPMLRCLKDNGVLGLLIDQNVAWQEGVFVDYFGRPAATTNGLALLALHTEAPVIPGTMVRLDNGKYRLILGTEVEIIRTGDRDADIISNTQKFTSIIEEMVRQYPDQWLWVHQRWKTKLCQIQNASHRLVTLKPAEWR